MRVGEQVRRRLALACRVAAIGVICAGMWGPPHRYLERVPRRVVYLVDRSASMDQGQRDWMTRRIASLEVRRPAPVERALITFGAAAAMASPVGTTPLGEPEQIARLIDATAVDGSRTNLEAAVLAAVGLLPASPGSAILLSDGRETAGQLGRVLPVLRHVGLHVCPVAVPTFAPAMTTWNELVVPPVVQRGTSVPIELPVLNGASKAKQGLVTVTLHGVTLAQRRVIIAPGWQVLSVAIPAIEQGSLPLDVRLEVPEDHLLQHRRAYAEVEGPPRILLVSETATHLPALAIALSRREIEVTMARPTELPHEAQGLVEHDAVMLFNVPASSLLPQQAEGLRTFVERWGGGLVVVGGEGWAMEAGASPSPIDPLLPMTYEAKGLKEAKRRVCIVLLIDRSTSMMGPRIAATKRAAVELIKQLSPEDLVGILAFDSQPYVVAEVQPAGRVESQLIEKLVKLRALGGTDVFPALAAAAQRLELTGATVKHIILLSDGNTPARRKAYETLLESLKRDGVTISTIGIGGAFINTTFLTFLAHATGGTFYQMRTLEELPQLIARDTQDAMGRLPFAEGYFRPVTSPASEWFTPLPGGPAPFAQALTGHSREAVVTGFTPADPSTLPRLGLTASLGIAQDSAPVGLHAWPVLRGYWTATAKPGALVDVTVNGGEGDDPLFARWTVERGRVAAFTSDADARWSPEWIRWEPFDATWAKVVRWVMRPRLSEELFIWVDERHQPKRLILEGFLRHPQVHVVRSDPPTHLFAGGDGRPGRAEDRRGDDPAAPGEGFATGEPLALPIIQSGPWRWEASLAQVPSGWHQVTIESGEGFAARWIQVGESVSPEEITGLSPHEEALRRIADATGCAYDEPEQAFLPPVTTTTTHEPAWLWWLPFVVLLLLLDVALRGPSLLQ